ncbi:MAG: hypothetical protein ABSD88_02065 [Candidatus Korobacteraceae bacterium]|jgi:hypothetical protein
MYITKQSAKQLYNEREAAEALGISTLLLYSILDEHVFNQGTPRPENIEFTASDLLLVSYWVETATQQKLSAASGS